MESVWLDHSPTPLIKKGMKDIKLILDMDVVNRYNKYYFSQHPKAKKKH